MTSPLFLFSSLSSLFLSSSSTLSGIVREEGDERVDQSRWSRALTKKESAGFLRSRWKGSRCGRQNGAGSKRQTPPRLRVGMDSTPLPCSHLLYLRGSQGCNDPPREIATYNRGGTKREGRGIKKPSWTTLEDTGCAPSFLFFLPSKGERCRETGGTRRIRNIHGINFI